jgi:hypothetical protein
LKSHIPSSANAVAATRNGRRVKNREIIAECRMAMGLRERSGFGEMGPILPMA